jgi:DNA-binding protein YbaB
MKEHDEDARQEDDVLRVREILQAHTSQGKAPTVETVDGLVRVTVDPQLRVVRIEFLDGTMDPVKRLALEKATADAVNAAMQKVVLSTSGALMQLEKRIDWKA